MAFNKLYQTPTIRPRTYPRTHTCVLTPTHPLSNTHIFINAHTQVHTHEIGMHAHTDTHTHHPSRHPVTCKLQESCIRTLEHLVCGCAGIHGLWNQLETCIHLKSYKFAPNKQISVLVYTFGNQNVYMNYVIFPTINRGNKLNYIEIKRVKTK